MIFNQTEGEEKNYLRQIISSLKQALNQTHLSAKEQEKTLRDHKIYLRENKADLDAQEERSMHKSILNTIAVGEGVMAKRKRLNKLLEIPYFGRIDFREKGNENNILPIYIGIHTFYDPAAKKTLFMTGAHLFPACIMIMNPGKHPTLLRMVS